VRTPRAGRFWPAGARGTGDHVRCCSHGRSSLITIASLLRHSRAGTKRPTSSPCPARVGSDVHSPGTVTRARHSRVTRLFFISCCCVGLRIVGTCSQERILVYTRHGSMSVSTSLNNSSVRLNNLLPVPCYCPLTRPPFAPCHERSLQLVFAGSRDPFVIDKGPCSVWTDGI